MAWDIRQPDSWAASLGLVAVPLFGHSGASQGMHTLLLDGERASCVLSVGDANSLLPSHEPLAWSWSSNVRHSVIVDASSGDLISRRWDTPDRIELRGDYSLQTASGLLDYFERTPPPSIATVIERALRSFRAIREHVAEVGGNDLDAIRLFTALLDWSNTRQQPVETIVRSSNSARPLISPNEFQDITNQLIEGERSGDYVLDPDLLIRHASGKLFQEAHIQINRSPIWQRRLWTNLDPTLPKPRGSQKGDAHYTPPSLARLLVGQAIATLRELRTLPPTLEILDPACGSGVFLVEAVRELTTTSSTANLRGVDSSAIAKVMADFTVSQTLRASSSQSGSVQIEIDDSLARQSWGQPDIIVMNPPFKAWKAMTAAERSQVKDILGEWYLGAADSSLAFLARAVKALKPNSVLASVVPAPLLESKSAQLFRKYVNDDPSLSLNTVGRFKGFGYFSDADVEPAFVIIARGGQKKTTITQALALPGAEDYVIRNLRLHNVGLATEDFEIAQVSATASEDASWMPQPLRRARFVDELQSRHPSVDDLFDPHLGIRPGDKPVFVLSEDALTDLTDEAERTYFRPVADKIIAGRIQSDSYVFYPYDTQGRLAITTEAELAQAVPNYYARILLPRKQKLESRKSLRKRKWWELVEPRGWLAPHKPKLVCAAFGLAGCFAFDKNGTIAVVQGLGWLPRQPMSSRALTAYVALLNSLFFESLVSFFCPRVRGGQYELYVKYVAQIPLPQLVESNSPTFQKLHALGNAMREGKRYSQLELELSVAATYGVDLTEFREVFAYTVDKRLPSVFQELSSRLKKETAHLSSMVQQSQHFAFRQIVAMGAAAVPLIVAEIHKRPSPIWLFMLRQLTGANPVAGEHRGNVDKMAADWLEWAKQHEAGDD